MTERTDNIWLPIYEQIHEHIRDSMKRRDQVIAFYLIVLVALIGSWDKLKEIQEIAATATWIVGVLCFIVVSQFWRWQITLHLSMVTIQSLMTGKRALSVSECEAAWNQVNEANVGVAKLMTPLRGVEINMIYLCAFLTSVPGYLVLRRLDFGILCVKTELMAFILNSVVYTIILAFFSALFVKRFSKFDKKYWMFRWLGDTANNKE